MFRHLLPTSLALLASGAPAYGYGHHNASSLRMSQIQVIGTHNSYHREIIHAERDVFEKYVPNPTGYYYSHSDLHNQLEYQAVRSFELDLHPDDEGGLYYPPAIWRLSNLTANETPFDGEILKKPGIKIFHVTDFDPGSVCHTFIDCLTDLKAWSDAHRNHLPVLIDLELKNDAPACELGGVCPGEATNWTLPRLLNVDAEILSVFPTSQLIRPDDVRSGNLTLEQSILEYGWPILDNARGRFMFFFDNNPQPNVATDIRNLYTSDGHESLQNRTVWTNSLEGSPDAAFIKHNEPRGDDLVEIQRLVEKGYIIRTRADVPIDTVLAKDTEMRESAFKSGAQIVSTDFPSWGMAARWGFDYVAWMEGKPGRCNPITAPEWCVDEALE
ncbi:hypothetical protein CC78DRAFT_542489 [Lojkania enalia]|uniref:PLC-like phosphodiesterase n=1 Tax=Lojkania enalia TaxID=147567 RepID=A0A9P4N8T9_9PLEO|nr:hypothetical protein CC78DRAFT_542489 [Didymosphaeria enalia]